MKKGITLVGLVVTIVIMLILSGVTISLTIGENGIIRQAVEAGKKQKEAEEKEKNALDELYSSMLVATNENSQITISMKDLTTLIEQKVEDKTTQLVEDVKTLKNQLNGRCNPKLLTTITLPSTESNSREVGQYYANTTSYTKKNSEDFTSYLSYDEAKGWKVLRSGNYNISNSFVGYFSGGEASIMNVLKIDGKGINLSSGSLRQDNIIDSDLGHITVYLEEGTIINFYNTIITSPVRWHYVDFCIYALFD